MVLPVSNIGGILPLLSSAADIELPGPITVVGGSESGAGTSMDLRLNAVLASDS